jgi:hypothetical protein
VPDPAKTAQSYLDNLPPPPAHESERDTIDGKADVLDACLEAASPPPANGRVVVRFTVNADGSAKNATVLLDELNDLALETCLTTALVSFHYPREGGAATLVTYPLVIQDGAIQHAEGETP